jgi:hypothetical protein
VTLEVSVNVSNEIGQLLLIGSNISPYTIFLVAFSICVCVGVILTGSKNEFKILEKSKYFNKIMNFETD